MRLGKRAPDPFRRKRYLALDNDGARSSRLVQLAEEGRVDLAAPVQSMLPWFEVPVVGRPITLHDARMYAFQIAN